GDVQQLHVRSDIQRWQLGETLHPFLSHGPGFQLSKAGFAITDHIGRKRRHESGCLAGTTKWTFRVFDPGIHGLTGLELFLALSTAVLVERHGIESFLCRYCREIMRNIVRDLTRRPLPSDL